MPGLLQPNPNPNALTGVAGPVTTPGSQGVPNSSYPNTYIPGAPGGGVVSYKPQPESYLNQDLSQSNPLPWQKYLNLPAASQAAGNLATTDNGSYYDKTLMRGINPTDTSLDFGGPGIMGDKDSSMTTAINNQYGAQLGNKLQSIQSGYETNKPMIQGQEVSNQVTELGQQYKNMLQNYQDQVAFQTQRQNMYNQWQQDQSAQTANYISMALGGAGTVAGLGVAAGKGP